MTDQPTTQSTDIATEIVADTKAPEEKSIYHLILHPERDPNARWYIVHTYSGHEERVAAQVAERVNALKLEDKVHEILVPVQEKIKISRGKKIPYQEKLFPGYMMVRMIMGDDAWTAVRNTRGITSFVGIGKNPTPIPQTEVDTIQKFAAQKTPTFKATFTLGEAVKIIEGPFAEFLGSVSSIDETKGKVTVLVSIFGRETPVELDFLQVAKI